LSSGFPPLPIDARLVFPDLAARTLDDVLLEMATSLAAAGVVRDPVELAERLRRREKEGCTGIGKEGVAFPHCRMQGLANVLVAVGLSREGIDFGTPDGKPIRVVFLLLSPWDAPAQHLQVLARLARLSARTPGLPDRLLLAGSPEAIARALRDAESGTSAAATA
jgi:mannitol/fructose-specific phosphotransferase system IIA component (Ntr-type)